MHPETDKHQEVTDNQSTIQCVIDAANYDPTIVNTDEPKMLLAINVPSVDTTSLCASLRRSVYYIISGRSRGAGFLGCHGTSLFG